MNEDKNYRDILTGGYTKDYLAEFERRTGDEFWGCIFIYIDHFKQYTDKNGWDAGQMTIMKLTRFLMRHIRADENVVRLKDDEFLILLNNIDQSRTFRVSRRIQLAALAQAPVTFSIGHAARQDGESLAHTIERALRNISAVKVLERQVKKARRTAAIQ